MFSYFPQSFISKTVSMLRNHVLSKLRNHKLLNLKVKFNMSSEQEFVCRNPTKIYKLDRFDQASCIRLSIFNK